MQQQVKMDYDPATGKPFPFPSHADQWRRYHGPVAWVYNPWTGQQRDASDIGSDCFGLLIIPASEPIFV